ncbi:MAG TPA: FAD-dependent oxidoreductase, partial [Stellaceae bacterium]|nr:FAD-dependent oxidoreductase [Stellaceae bacterium]
PVATRKLGVVAAANTSVLMAMAGLRMPLESYPLQALVSEPIKPIFPCVVMSNTIHAYVSQSDKGELVIGAGTDAYVSYTQRGGLHIATHTLDAICELFPMFRRMKMLRNWGGIVDVTPDRSPIIGKTPVPGLYVNCGWGTGGFKATPGSGHVFAATIARDEPHPIAAPFRLDRFRDGALIDEAAAAAVAH